MKSVILYLSSPDNKDIEQCTRAKELINTVTAYGTIDNYNRLSWHGQSVKVEVDTEKLIRILGFFGAEVIYLAGDAKRANQLARSLRYCEYKWRLAVIDDATTDENHDGITLQELVEEDGLAFVSVEEVKQEFRASSYSPRILSHKQRLLSKRQLY